MNKEPKTPKANISMLNNVNLDYSEAREQLKPAIRQFLFRWLDPSTTLKRLNEIGIGLYQKIIISYDEEDEI